MKRNKIIEFLTVLIFGLIFGMGGWLVVMKLEGTALIAATVALAIAAVLAWQYLRRRFERTG